MTAALEPSLSKGYALCSPLGAISGHSYRATEAEAIAAVFTNEEHREAYWAEAQAQGWSVKFVYARIFMPVFFVNKPAEEEGAA